MGHLDALDAKYRDRGLVVVAVTNEERGLVDKFVTKNSAKHRIVIEDGDSLVGYQSSVFPSTFLIDANGKVAWAGVGASFEPRLLERLLREVMLPPALPDSMESIRRSFEKKDYAAAKKALDAKVAAEGTPAGEKSAAEKALQWIETASARMLDSAADTRKEGDGWAAAETLREAAARFKGLESGDRAKAALDDLMRDKDLKREVEAGDAWEKFADRAKSLKPDQAAQGCRQFAKKWEGTRAATKAEAAASGFEKKAGR